MTPPDIRDWQVTNNPIGTPFTPTAPTGVQAHDRLYIIGFWDVTISSTAPVDSSFVLIASGINYGNDGQGLAVWEKLDAVGSGSDNWSMTSTNNNDCFVITVAVQGASNVAPLTFVNSATSNVEAQSPVLTGPSGTSVAGDLLLYAGGVDGESATQQFSFGSYTGSFTEVVDNTNNNWANGCLAKIVNVNGAQGTVGCTATRISGSTGDCRGWAQFVWSIPSATAVGPTIDVQPTPQTALSGSTATFTISATTSGGTLHYQWKDDGSNVGTDSNTYTTGILSPSDNGSLITCDVTDDNGTTVSNSALLTVLYAASLCWFRA